MDTQKDIKNKPSSENVGKEVQIDEDRHFKYVVKKLERIATALHLVTNFLPEHEPLRTSIRQHAISLLSDIYHVKKRYKADSTDTVSLNVSTDIEGLLSLLSVAHTSGFISDMNFEVLKREIDHLSDLIGSDESLTSLPKISEEFFNLKEEGLQKEEAEDTAVSKLTSVGAAPEVKEEDEEVKTTPETNQKVTKKSQDADDEKEEKTPPKKQRRKIILGLFEDQDEITISDVESVIEGYSTKTLQRDLSALVDMDIIEKHGKRRWTSYTLAE